MVTDKSTLLIPVLPRISCLKFTAHSANTESQCYTALTGLFIDPLTNKCNLIIIAIKTASYIITKDCSMSFYISRNTRESRQSFLLPTDIDFGIWDFFGNVD